MQCVICTDVTKLLGVCVQCQIKVCLTCFNYGQKINIFSNPLFSTPSFGYFYCSIKCISLIHASEEKYFGSFIRNIENGSDYGNVYVEFQERAYIEIISPQIKKIIGEV